MEGEKNGFAVIRGWDGYIAAAQWTRTVIVAVGLLFGIVVAADVTSPPPPSVWTDPDNNCEYVIRGQGIAPRLNSMGLQQGCSWLNPDAAPLDMPPPPDEIAAASAADAGEEAKQPGGRCVR